jgi:hypothetical protein
MIIINVTTGPVICKSICVHKNIFDEIKTLMNTINYPFRIIDKYLILYTVVDQVISRQPLTAYARIRAQVKSCWIFGGHNDTGTGSSPNYSFYPVNIIIP